MHAQHHPPARCRVWRETSRSKKSAVPLKPGLQHSPAAAASSLQVRPAGRGRAGGQHKRVWQDSLVLLLRLEASGAQRGGSWTLALSCCWYGCNPPEGPADAV